MRSCEIEKVLYALAKPSRESRRLVAIGKFFQARFSDRRTPRKDLAKFALVSALIVNMAVVPASNPASPGAIARSEAHRFLFSRPMPLNGDQDASAQHGLRDAVLLNEHIAGPVGSSLHLWRKMNTLVL